jgi:allophanate hydrolase subunit 2
LVQGIETLAGHEFTVGTSSNRVGIRLDPGGGGLEVLEEPLASLPMVTGAVQLPPDGCPIVLGVDHATLGGYPVVAVVIDADAGILGRLAPGNRVVFEVVTTQRAAALDAERRLVLTRAVTGITPRVNS